MLHAAYAWCETPGVVNASPATAVPPPPPASRVVLVGKPGCHLCDTARGVVARVSAEAGESYEERSILDDPALQELYGEQIPVTLVDGVQVDFWRVDEARLRAALARPARTP